MSAHEVNVINVDTGGGTFTFTAEKGAGQPLVDVPVYVFSSSGSYLGLTAHTDANGQTSFDLSDGEYKFRVDYLGYQFWSGVSTVPTTLSDVLTIPTNLAGLPGISVPCGFTKGGLPIGMQILGKHFDETTILRAAKVFEDRTDHHKKRPEISE